MTATRVVKYGSRKLAVKPALGGRVAFTSMPGVSVITCTNRAACRHNLLSNYIRQNYPQKELVVILNHNEINPMQWLGEATADHSIRVMQVDQSVTLGECLNLAAEQCQYPYVARFDDDDYYGPAYLQDSLQPLLNRQADVAGKGCRYIFFKDWKVLALLSPYLENCYTEGIGGATMVMKKEIFQTLRFPSLNLGEDTAFLQDCTARGLRIYSTGRFHYAVIRQNPVQEHTWQVPHQTLLDCCSRSWPCHDFTSIVDNRAAV